MALSYLTSTLSEQEYLEQRFKQDAGTGRVTRAAINNSKMFSLDTFNRELIIVMSDIRDEVTKAQNLDTALIFLQKLIYWSNEDHPHILMGVSATPTRGTYKAKDVESLKGYVSQMRLYMKKVAGIPISSEDVKDYKLSYPPGKDKEEAQPLLKKEFRLICDNQRSPRRQMLYRVMRGAEARIGAMIQLRKRHFNLEVRPIEITFPKSIMKKKNGVSFTNVKYVLEEDQDALIQLLTPLSDDDLVFGTNEKKELAVNTEEKVWSRLVKKLGLGETYKHNGWLKKNIHSIKAMTFTAAVKAVNETYANAYGDHSRYTKNYLRWPKEEKIENFKKLERLISIYTTTVEVHDDSKLHEENEYLRSKINKIEEQLETISIDKKEETKVELSPENAKQIIKILKNNNYL